MLIAGFTIRAQEFSNDSIQKIDEVIITGQYNAQSVQKSVFDVHVITSKTIQQYAGQNLADVLNHHLNLMVTPNTKSGKSEVSLFGLDGQYFKILIDNVPLVSDTGMGNNVDLTQINLENVARVEIVEGSMAVAYGGNTVTGIINIITKKSSAYKWEIKPSFQEETVGGEYSWALKGRHIQSLFVSNSLSENWFVSGVYSRNKFNGFFDDYKGKNHIENDTLRGYSWMPKEQLSTEALLKGSLQKVDMFYKLSYLNEKLTHYSENVSSIANSTTGLLDKFGNDTNYDTNRLVNHFHLTSDLFSKYPLLVELSNQYQKRYFQNFIYDLYTRTANFQEKDLYQSRNTWYAKASINDLFSTERIKTQLGVEALIEDGFTNAASGSLVPLDDERHQMNSIDIFASAEIQMLHDKFMVRPGIRYSIQSAFENQYAASLSAKYSWENDVEIRTVVGSSFRTPDFEELYTLWDTGTHLIKGDENLKSEKSFSMNVFLKKNTQISNQLKLKNKLKFMYLKVNDRIDLSLTSLTPLTFRYININTYKSLSASTENSFQFKDLNMNIGATLMASSSLLKNADGSIIHENLDDYLYNFQLNSSLSYFIKPIKLQTALHYKFNGKQEEFILTEDEQGNELLKRGQIDAYQWMDMSLKKSLFNNNTQLTLGARNLFNITNIKTTAVYGASHGSSEAGKIPVGYGRSYYVKFQHQFKF